MYLGEEVFVSRKETRCGLLRDKSGGERRGEGRKEKKERIKS